MPLYPAEMEYLQCPGIPDDLKDMSTCLLNMGKARSENPDDDCGKPAAWHIWYEHEEGSGDMTQACDPDLGRALGWRKVKEFHEFGSACNLRASWWIAELGTCVSEETGIALGFLVLSAGA